MSYDICVCVNTHTVKWVQVGTLSPGLDKHYFFPRICQLLQDWDRLKLDRGLLMRQVQEPNTGLMGPETLYRMDIGYSPTTWWASAGQELPQEGTGETHIKVACNALCGASPTPAGTARLQHSP